MEKKIDAILRAKILSHKEVVRLIKGVGMKHLGTTGSHEKWKHPKTTQIFMLINQRGDMDRSNLKDLKEYIQKLFK